MKQPPQPENSENGAALGAIVARLRSPPLLFGLGALVVLASAAAAGPQTVRAIAIPAVAVAALALAAWLLSRRNASRVDVRGRKVAGTLVGVAGLPSGRDLPGRLSVNVDEVEQGGKAIGVEYQRSKGERP